MTITSFLDLLRRRKWTKRDYAIAAVGFGAAVFLFSSFLDSNFDSVNRPPFGTAGDDLIKLTLLGNSKVRGSFCLDGSLPGYHFKRGSGSGSNSWLLHIEGGGWCNTIESCASRGMTKLGSSNFMEKEVLFSGILSSDPSRNPEFYNWNKVKVRYCDGASFAGRPEAELKNQAGPFFRGQLIWEALMDELLSIGLSKAKQALLTGCSAGGLATLIHCDDFRDRLPKASTVKCLADASFFLDEPDVLDNRTMRSFYHDVFFLQGLVKSLDKNCVAKMEPFKCLFPREIIKSVRTPLFLVNPAYDFWQIQNVLVPDIADPDHHWTKCRLNIEKCDENQIKTLQGFRNSLLNSLGEFQRNKGGGMFINSCFIHCQTWMSQTWHSPTSPRINSKTVAESVGDWFFNRNVAKQIDCPYPCNPTCYNMDLTRSG